MTASVKLKNIELVKCSDRGAYELHALTFHSLIGDFFIVRIPVSELQELLETLHVPGGKETKPELYVPGRPFKFQRVEAALPPSLPTSSEPGGQTESSASCRAAG